MKSSLRYFLSSPSLVGNCHCSIYLLMMTMILLLSSSLLLVVKAAVICPPAADYAPCDCEERNGTITLTCDMRNLNDSQVSDILDAFLTTPGVSPVGDLNLYQNRLTRVPTQIKFFDQLKRVTLQENSITSVESGAFNATFPGGQNSSLNYFLPILHLDLMTNQITTIAPGAFKGDRYGNNTIIHLGYNNLTRFESTVFQTVAEQMAPYADQQYTQIHLYGNPFECDCHLAWLIRDNRHLLPVVYEYVYCSNGTRFGDLDPNGFADCPPFVCPLGYDGYYADPLSCSSFYLCSANVAYPYNCPTDLVFNSETQRCDAVVNVEGRCGPFVCPSTDGYFPDPKSCASYFVCIDSEPIQLDCPPGFVFNPAKSQCDKPENVPNCSN